MADSRQRVPLQSSVSFSGSSTGDLNTRALKRRPTMPAMDTAYFTPSSSTFCPRPYQPQQTQQPAQSQRSHRLQEQTSSSSSSLSLTRTNLTRNHSASATHVNLDPLSTDTSAVFIHPPFTEFPGADKQKAGLTYNLMAENPEWFLDAADFIQVEDPDVAADDAADANIHRISYPSQLEPPRGWCPARKKDVKEGWPEGEEPRLRCTFCRRQYSGVNAKSMWRRHVYEKHKIAMSNRRDNQDRKGGRSSNSKSFHIDRIFLFMVHPSAEENKDKIGSRGGRSTRRASEETDQGSSRAQEFRSQTVEWKRPSTPTTGRSRHQDKQVADRQLDYPLPQLLPDEHSGPEGEPDVFRAIKSSSTPPLTPGFSPSKSASSRRLRDIILESPYDPLVTPSFRHSPARLPSDQPWRFPSPSHPLHSRAQELSLSMLVRGEASPVVSGLDVSPIVILPSSEREKRSIFSSPLFASSDKDKDNALFPGPSPRRLFYDGPRPVPITDRSDFMEHRIPQSPFGRSKNRPEKLGLTSLNDAIQTWQSDLLSSTTKSSEAPGLLGPIELQGEDPFADGLYTSWVNLTGTPEGHNREPSPPGSILEESPVVRTSQQSSSTVLARGTSGLSGLGMGLMDAFLSGKSRLHSNIESSDDDESMIGRLVGSPVQAGRKTRRGLSTGFDTDLSEAQPKKRRKTISGRN